MLRKYIKQLSIKIQPDNKSNDTIESKDEVDFGIDTDFDNSSERSISWVESSRCGSHSSFSDHSTSSLRSILIYKSPSISERRIVEPVRVDTFPDITSSNIEPINDYPPKHTSHFLSWLDLEEKYFYDGHEVHSDTINKLILPSEYFKIKYISTNTLVNLIDVFPNVTTIILTNTTTDQLQLINHTNQRRIIKIKFNDTFNDSISFLSKTPNIMAIKFGREFNQPVDPLCRLMLLKKIKFGREFNQPVDPLCRLIRLRIVIFGKKFNQPISKLCQLNSLNRLYFGNVEFKK